ncbi:MAG: hypothetical protein ACKOCW_06315 [Planctomycetaceae bacterium]
MPLQQTRATSSRQPARARIRLAAVGVAAASLLTVADPTWGGILVVGNISTFATGSTAGNPAGTWSLGDKSFTYLEQSGISQGPTSPELITIEDSPNDQYHSFSLAGLGGLGSGTYALGYRVDVNPSSPYFLNTVALDSTHISDTATVYKDVFSTLSAFAAATVHGTGDLASLTSLNGAPTGAVSLGLATQVWVRDTIVLDATGHVSSVVNVFTQAVPEIDPASFSSVLALVVGSLSVVERRRSGSGNAAVAPT